MVLYLLYKGFVYWNYNLFKEQKQVETWNSRVKKQRKMKQENKNKKVTLKTKTYSTKSKALAKEAVEYIMKHYPNLMEKLKNS